MSKLPRVGQTCIYRIGGDQYAGKIVTVEGDIIYIQRDGHEEIRGLTRCKKNRKGTGYGQQEYMGGKWVYKHVAKYRGLSTWYPIEGEASTYLDPGF